MSTHKITGNPFVILFKYLHESKIQTDNNKFDASLAYNADVDLYITVIPFIYEPRFQAVYERRDGEGKDKKLIISQNGCYLIVNS